MSSFNNYIKFALDIEDQNIVFEDYFFRLVNGHKQKVYQAAPFVAHRSCGTMAV